MNISGSSITSGLVAPQYLGKGSRTELVFLNGLGEWSTPSSSLADGSVTDAKLRSSAGTSVIGRSAGTTGTVADIAASSDGDVLRRASGSLGFGAIPESSVTNLVSDLAAKAPTSRSIATTGPLSGGGDLSADRTLTTSMSTGKLIGRTTASSGVMEEITPGAGLSMSSLALTANINIPARMSGRYYYPPFAVTGTSGAGATLNRLYAVPFWIGDSQAFTKIAIALVTAVASAMLRVGLYTDGGCKPSSLIVDAGQIDCTSSFGVKEVTITQTLSGLVWLACAWQGAVATSYLRLGQSMFPFIGSTSIYSAWPGMGYSQDSVSGGFPSSWGSTYNLETTANTIPAVALKV